MKTVLAHFYFATAAATAAGQSAWHVAVIDLAENMDDVKALAGQAQRERTLNMAEAKAAGIDLGSIGEAFAVEVGAALVEAQSEVAALGALLETQGAALEKARARLTVLEAERATDAAPA